MQKLGAFMQKLGPFMQKLRRFMETEGSFEPTLVAECEEHAAEDLNRCRLRLLQQALSPLRGALVGHRVAFDEHRDDSPPATAPPPSRNRRGTRPR